MESIIQALGGIVLRALPTFVLVVLLHFYLKYMFFRPLHRVLERRYELTEGARVAAEESLARAAAKADEYESALRDARAGIYQNQERFFRTLQQDHERAVAQARANADAAIRQARSELALEAVSARQALAAESDALAEQIAQSLLSRRAA
jgi:F-type H+-transporting ATPase subunit b